EVHAGRDEQRAVPQSVREQVEALRAQLGRLEAVPEQVRQVGEQCHGLANALGGIYSWGIDRWKVQEYEGLLRFLRRAQYEAAIRDGSLEVPVVETDHPIAFHSDDVRFPWGAKNDNSICPKFNARLYEMFPAGYRLKVLDLGCAGGGFVRTLLDDGHLAVGLEGSDHPKMHQLGEWGTVPRHLHNCAITRPFTVVHNATRRLTP